MDFVVRVSAVKHARQIEEFGSLVNFGPESFFERLLRCTKYRLLANEVKMCQNANDLGKPMGLQDIEELELFLSKSYYSVEIHKGPSRTISKPKEPSIMRRTRSATLPMSIIEFRSLLHSMNVRRLFFPDTTVTGPLISFSVCFVYRRTRLFTRVLLPTPDGPTTAIITGGGMSSGVRFTRGT